MAQTLPSVLIGTDLKTDPKNNSKNALKVGLTWARRFGLEAVVCHVNASNISRETLRVAHLIDQTSEAYVEQALLGKIKTQIEGLAELDNRHVSFKILNGKPVDEIIKLADEIKPELLVLGTKERTALDQIFLGNVTEKIIQSGNYPCLAVRDNFASSPQRITFLSDFSGVSARAWYWTKKLAREFNSEVSMIHVVTAGTTFLTDEQKKDFGNSSSGKEDLLNAATKLVEAEMNRMVMGQVLKKINYHVIKSNGGIGESVVQFLEKERPHLLVMGSHGHGMVKKLILGSNADYLLSHSDCNILIVRP